MSAERAPESVGIRTETASEGITAEIDVWGDGVVHFSGSRCQAWRGVVTRVDPARVAWLVQQLEEAGLRTFHEKYYGSFGTAARCTTGLAVKSGGEKTSEFRGCGAVPAPLAGALELIQTAVGTNPCA